VGGHPLHRLCSVKIKRVRAFSLPSAGRDGCLRPSNEPIEASPAPAALTPQSQSPVFRISSGSPCRCLEVDDEIGPQTAAAIDAALGDASGLSAPAITHPARQAGLFVLPMKSSPTTTRTRKTSYSEGAGT
jgi:hypothetical protein